jgi:hypothetical protein
MSLNRRRGESEGNLRIHEWQGRDSDQHKEVDSRRKPRKSSVSKLDASIQLGLLRIVLKPVSEDQEGARYPSLSEFLQIFYWETNRVYPRPLHYVHSSQVHWTNRHAKSPLETVPIQKCRGLLPLSWESDQPKSLLLTHTRALRGVRHSESWNVFYQGSGD